MKDKRIYCSTLYYGDVILVDLFNNVGNISGAEHSFCDKVIVFTGLFMLFIVLVVTV